MNGLRRLWRAARLCGYAIDALRFGVSKEHELEAFVMENFRASPNGPKLNPFECEPTGNDTLCIMLLLLIPNATGTLLKGIRVRSVV